MIRDEKITKLLEIAKKENGQNYDTDRERLLRAILENLSDEVVDRVLNLETKIENAKPKTTRSNIKGRGSID